MSQHELLRLRGERAMVERMIETTPYEDAMDRASLIARLEGIQEQLSAERVDERVPARARLTFNGRPVVGNHGIFADFGAKAVSAFSEAVAAVSASLTGGLAGKGPIPNRSNHQLLITSTALGSFGFELEELPQDLAKDECSSVGVALERTQRLLAGSVTSDDDVLTEAASELDQRAIDKVRDFVGELSSNEAICALQVNEHVFRFTDLGQVRHSLERISRDNLQEEEQDLNGEFTGILPNRRTFEFRISLTDQVIVGKVASSLGELDDLNKRLHQPTTIKVMMTRAGAGRPRYRLLALPRDRLLPAT